MLRQLTIQNFALIEQTVLNFSEGFTIITGETGAGKSILLDALSLILGKRADLSAIRNKDEKCIVEACFDLEKYQLRDYFFAQDLDYHHQTIIRREILPSGKSRAFVNDSPVSLQQLSDLSVFLIDIHSQMQTTALFSDVYHLDILDTLAQNASTLKEYKSGLKQYKTIQKQLEKLNQEKLNAENQQDYQNFLLQELMEANLEGINQEELEKESAYFSNLEQIEQSLWATSNIIQDEQYGILQTIIQAKQTIQKITELSADYKQLHERLVSCEIELKDISSEIESASESLVNNPERAQEINEKLQKIYQLQSKHQVQSIDELLNIQEQLQSKVFYSQDIDLKIETLTIEGEKLNKELLAFAAALHQNRVEVIPKLIEQLEMILPQLGMSNARFKYELTSNSEFFQNGTDAIDVLFSANKGMAFNSLKKVASGGELSRIMLTVKAVLARYVSLPTLIFDEIDTGVSGEVADKMGEIMKQMSQSMQVFSITHLPQVAAKGNEHFKVSKNQEDEITQTQINRLTFEERIQEVAKMLSGNQITTAAIEQAKSFFA